MENSGAKTLESMSQAVWYNRWTLSKFKKYLKRYGKVWAIDIERGYINETKEKVNGKAFVGEGNIESGKYFFDKREFNTVVCLNVLEHIKDDRAAIKNLFQLLEAGGYLILLVPSHPNLYGVIDASIGHFRRYAKDDLLEI